MKYITKLNREIYRCISEDIFTDEVIITDNQIEHIMERHPESYIYLLYYMASAIEDPDYILKDKHKNTGLVIKKIKKDEKYIQIVLRIITTCDNGLYKNSIISCWIISNRRLNNYLKNREVLYRKE